MTTWICDACGQPVSGDDGCVEYLTDDNFKSYGYRIIHRKPGCRAYLHEVKMGDIDLDHLVGPNGMVTILSMLDPGRHITPSATEPETADVRGIVELMRRLHVPHYEEARQYMDSADPAQWPADGNEVWVYTQRVLKGLINGEYRP